MQLNFNIGNADSSLSEVSLVLDSFSSVLKWIFFIVVAIIVGYLVFYIKRKNAHGNKHS